jgi:putative ABC transport system permease protein
MILSYLKLALRQIRLYKTYSVINIVGLSAGLAACFIILVYVRYQTSFDKYNENLDNIYLVTTYKQTFGWTDPETPMILAPTLRNEIAEVGDVSRWIRRRSTVVYGNKSFEEKACTYADPDIFKILTLPFSSGTNQAVEKERDFLVISETLSRKYFGDRNPIGEAIRLTCAGATYELKVTAVMKDIPTTSTFSADVIGPLYIGEKFLSDIYANSKKDPLVSWETPGVTTYVALPRSADIGEVGSKLAGLSKQHIDPAFQETLRLFPLKGVYFHSSFMINNDFPQGDVATVEIYSAAAFLLLFIACVNYLMLSLGKASLRTREVGVRKVFGARDSDLLRQAIVESTLMTLLALPFALALVELLLQNLTGLLGTTIAGPYFHHMEYLLAFIALTVFVGLAAGGYVSLYLSRFNPIDILNRKLGSGPRKVFLRRVLMISQMIIFLALTLTSLAVYKQLRYFQDRDMGFNKQDLVVFYPDNKDFGRTLEAFKNEIQQNPQIFGVSGANMMPMTVSRGVSSFPKKDHPDENLTIEGISADRDFVETMGIKMVSGLSFRNHPSAAPGGNCLINETAARELGFRDPIGETLGGSTVIGVVGDFNMHSLHERIGPLRITESTKYSSEVAVRVAPKDIQATAKWISEKGTRFNNGSPLDFESFDERLGALYTQEQKFATAIGYATGLAIFVACLGIFGMSVFVSQQRVKEIGIRKVLGATLEDVYYSLTREFVGLISVSALVAFPLAFYIVRLWLQQFAYRIDISMWDLLLAALIDTVIVLATVSYHAVRAALANPVVSLRYE